MEINKFISVYEVNQFYQYLKVAHFSHQFELADSWFYLEQKN